MFSAASAHGFSPIFRQLIAAFDSHGNALLLIVAVAAFLLRRRPQPLALVRLAAAHPWPLAAIAFVLLCAGSLRVYHDHPLSMDEYVPLFQAQAFAAGRLGGAFPPEMLDRLIPGFFQGYFFTVSHASGAVSGNYWPSFALLLAPFVWIGAPWAANPALGALALPALHRLTLRLTGSADAAGWAMLLAAASPAFVVNAISYYSMPAHLLANLLFALLLLTPSPARALAAGAIGSIALTLHNPVPHLLFAVAFLAWLALRREARALAFLAVGYAPICLLLGAGWHQYLASFAVETSARGGRVFASGGVGETLLHTLAGFLTLPPLSTVHARIAGLSKVWTWAAAGLLVLAAYGARSGAARSEVRVLAWALAITFLGYFIVSADQGHGWGYRYLHSAWFVLPVLGAVFLASRDASEELRTAIGWTVVLSLVLANGLRLVQVEGFVARHLAQVPPLARPADDSQREIVLVDMRAGFYTQDLVQNDPFLRGPRITLVYRGAADTAALMAARFPAYRRAAQGAWGEQWTAK